MAIKSFFLGTVCATVLLGFSALSVLAQDETHDPTGLWLTKNERSAIRISHCEDDKEKLCGHIAWIIEGGMQYDSENPDENLRKRPMCGLQILRSFDQNSKDPNKWEDGKIYKADDGDLYNANLEMIGMDRLRVHGYVGIPLFGKTQVWNRVAPEDYPKCKPPRG